MRSPPLLQVIVMQNGDYGCVHDEDMLSDEHWRHYNLVMVMLQYVLPLTAVTFTYGHMAKVRENVQSIAKPALQRLLGGNFDFWRAFPFRLLKCMFSRGRG